MNFPTSFSTNLIDIREQSLSQIGSDAATTLAERGFYVSAGLRAPDVAEIGGIAGHPSVREYCPRDNSEERFFNTPSTKEWLNKERGLFQLRSLGNGALAGYGWTGPETCTEIPGGDTTFAVRLSPDYARQGLATPFTKVIVAGSTALYGEDLRIWLETWGSNTAAVKTYLGAGAALVTTRDDYRDTLTRSQNESNGKRRDIRLFMQFFNRTVID